MQEVLVCPICNNDKLKETLRVQDHFASQENFKLYKCSPCELLLTSPVPDENQIVTYYKSNSYVSHGDSVNPLFDSTYKFIQGRNLKYKRKIIEKYTLGKNILDYGCGAGSFLQYMTRYGWTGFGIEPDTSAKQIAINKGINITDLQNLNTKYDCISLFHVLEHVHQLESTLQKLIEHLDRNGIIVLALPNFKSADATNYQEFWAGYDVPRHLYHFSQKSIFNLSKKIGLNIVSTHPLYFDSYYVSLLSEKYKTGKSNLLKAMYQGYKSNSKATKTKEYSSLIYILSK